MSSPIRCMHCDAPVRATEAQRGTSIRCPSCHELTRVPDHPKRGSRAGLWIGVVGLLLGAGLAASAFWIFNRPAEQQAAAPDPNKAKKKTDDSDQKPDDRKRRDATPKKKTEAENKDADDAAKKQADDDALAKKKADEDALAKKKADDDAKTKAAEDALAKKKADDELAKKKADAELAKKDVKPAVDPVPPKLTVPSTVVSDSFDRVYFSHSPTRFVVVAITPPFKDATYKIIQIDTGKQKAEFQPKKAWDAVAVNADGTMIAGRGGFEKSIEVHSAKGVQSIGQLKPGQNVFFDFTADDKLLVVFSDSFKGNKCEVIDPATGKVAVSKEIAQEESRCRDVSADRKLYGSVSAGPFGENRALIVRKTDTLETVRQFPVASNKKAFFFECQGMAFSPDGKQVALLVLDDMKTRIICWDWQKDEKVHDFSFDRKLEGPFGDNQLLPLEWLPDASCWLVHGQFLVDVKSGKELLKLPPNPEEWGKGRHRFVDSRTIVYAKSERNNKSVELTALNRDELDAAVKIAREGGDPNASRLPPLKAADLANVRLLTLPDAPVAWKVPVDAARGKVPAPNLPVKTPTDMIEQVFVTREYAAVIGLVSAEPKGERNRVRLEVFDLRQGKALDDVELFKASAKRGPLDHLPMPHSFLFIGDVHAEGKFVAVREPGDKKRVDVWSLPGVKHVFGLAPFEGDGDDLIGWTGMAGDVLLTASSRRLIAWKLPEGKAMYSMAASFVPGSFAFSPNRKVLAALVGREFILLDPLTGDVFGKMPLPADAKNIRAATAAFRADGKALAALIPNLAEAPGGFSLEQIIFAFSGQSVLATWNLETGAVDQSMSITQPPRRIRWMDSNYLLNGTIVFDSQTGDAFTELSAFPNQFRPAFESPDARLWFVLGPIGGPARLVCQTLPDEESLSLPRLIKEKKVNVVFGPDTPISLNVQGKIAPAVLDDLKARLARGKHPIVNGSKVTLTIRLQEGPAEAIKIQDIGPMAKAKAYDVPGLSITGEATLRDEKGEIWKASFKDKTSQGIGVIRTDNVTEYFHKPLRDRAEAWVRYLPLPSGIIRDGNTVSTFPRPITLKGD